MTKEAIKSLSYDLITLLPRGSISAIAEKTGLNRNSVRMILRGVWSNEAVIQEALTILERQKNIYERAISAMAKE